MKREELILSIIADDAYAISFQSMAQYRTALIKYIKSLSPAATEEAGITAIGGDGNTKPFTSAIENVFLITRADSKTPLFYQSEIDLHAFKVNLNKYLIVPIETPITDIVKAQESMGISTPQPSATAFDILQKHHSYIEKHGDTPSEYNEDRILAAMEEYAAKTVAEREVSDEEIKAWANTVDIVRELNDPFVKTEDDLSPYQWAVFGAKWMRELIKERNK